MKGSDSPIYKAFLEKFRSRNLLESINSGEDGPLPFTRAFEYIRHQTIPGDVKKKGYIGIIDSIEDFCRENESKIHPLYKETSKLINCAKNDVHEDNIEDAESDLYTVERFCLFKLWKKLSAIKSPNIKNYLLKNMIQADFDISGMGAYVQIEE